MHVSGERRAPNGAGPTAGVAAQRVVCRVGELEYDLERWRDATETWHFRLVRRESPGAPDDESFQARLGYVRYLIWRGLVRFDVDPSAGTV